MAKRRTPAPPNVPDALRDAVERTVQATQLTRERASDAVDEIVKGTEERAERVRRGAGTGAESVRDRVRGAIDPLRPATADDVRELRSELRAIVRRLDAIEERLPPRPKSSASSGSRSTASKASAARKAAGARKAGSSRKQASKRAS